LVNNGPVPGLQEVNVTILSLAFRRESSEWQAVPLPVTELKVNLLDPAPIQLAPNERLPAGTYTAFRLTLGPHPTVKVADGTLYPLQLPPDLAKGIPLRGPLVIDPSGRVDSWLILDLLTAVGPLPPCAGVPTFCPAIALIRQKALTGSVTGTVLDQATGAPLPGVGVSARSLAQPGPGDPLERRTLTDAHGSFTLDLLPGGPNLVVTQPQVGTTTYEAAGLEVAVVPGRQQPTTVTLACTPCPAPGSVLGSLRSPLTPGRRALVELFRAPEGGGARFAVRHAILHPGQHDYAFTQVPQGRYLVRVTQLPGLSAPFPSTIPPRESPPFQVDPGAHREDL
jgi:hypothetical protein